MINNNMSDFEELGNVEYKDLVEYNRDKVGLLSQDELLYYASDLDSLEDYLDYFVCGCMDNDEFENYDYPCIVLIREYEKCTPCINVETYHANVRALDDYLVMVESVKNELEKKFVR